jgi:hypothetical protein
MVMSFCGVSVLFSVTVLNLYEKSRNTKSQYRLPYLVRWLIIDICADRLGIKRDEKNFLDMLTNDPRYDDSNNNSRIDSTEKDFFNNIAAGLNKMNHTNELKLRASSVWKKKSQIRRFERKRAELNDQFKNENLKLHYSHEWLFLSLVIDRIIFWLFTLFTIIAYVIILFIYPVILQPDKNEDFMAHNF